MKYEFDTAALKHIEDHGFSLSVLSVPGQKKGESGERPVLLTEQMDTSAEAEDRLGLGDASALMSGAKEARPGRTAGGTARSALVVKVITSGWHPRLRTCPALSREVV